MTQPDRNNWSTKIRISSLDERNAKAFMEMSYRVARLYGVTKDAEWSCKPLGDNYSELTAEYEIKPLVPILKKPSITIGKKQHSEGLQPQRR